MALLRANLARSEAALGICLDFLLDPDRPETSIRLTRLLIDRGIGLSDDLHERLLRTQLRHEPYRLDLTTSLVGLLLKGDRSLVPVSSPVAQPPRQTLAELASRADEAARRGDAAARFAALWQAIFQHRDSPRGWAEFALAAAERRSWADARAAARAALGIGIAADPAAAGALLKALHLMVEQKELRDVDAAAAITGLPRALETRPEAVSIMLRLGRAGGAALVPFMLRDNAGQWKASLVAALAAFNRSDFEACYRRLRDAFEQNADETLRETVTLYSAQVDRVIRELGVADEMADWLSERSRHDPIETLIAPSPGVEARESVRAARRKALERGLPSVFLVTHPKTATVSVANIFSSGFALPTAVYCLITQRVVAPWLADYRRGGACYVTHLNPSPANIALLAQGAAPNIIVHVRDPRQLLVSLLEHHRRYPDQLPESERALYGGDRDRALRHAIEIELPKVIGWLTGWVNARAKLRIDFTHFEEFVNSRDAFIERIIDLYGGAREYFNREAGATEHGGIDYHRRLGSTDEWRTRMSPAQIDLVNRAIPEHFWGVFNWSA